MSGRSKFKHGRRISLYLSNESIAKLSKLSGNNKYKSKIVDCLIRGEFEKIMSHRAINSIKTEDTEIKANSYSVITND